MPVWRKGLSTSSEMIGSRVSSHTVPYFTTFPSPFKRYKNTGSWYLIDFLNRVTFLPY